MHKTQSLHAQYSERITHSVVRFSYCAGVLGCVLDTAASGGASNERARFGFAARTRHSGY